jgi:hypothetical protein
MVSCRFSQQNQSIEFRIIVTHYPPYFEPCRSDAWTSYLVSHLQDGPNTSAHCPGHSQSTVKNGSFWSCKAQVGDLCVITQVILKPNTLKSLTLNHTP